MKKTSFYLLWTLLFLPMTVFGARGWLWVGVSDRNLTQQEQKAFGVDHGVFIQEVMPNSPAEKAELLGGDIITAVNSEEIADANEFRKVLKENAGDLVELTILRGGKDLQIKVQLDEEEGAGGSTMDLSDLSDLPASININAGTKESQLDYLIPIIAVFMSLLIPIMAFYFRYRTRAIISKERLAAIEKGIELPPEPLRMRRFRTPLDVLRRGFICLAIGAAFLVYYFVAISVAQHFRGWALVAGLVLFFIGIALILWYRFASKENDSGSPQSGNPPQIK